MPPLTDTEFNVILGLAVGLIVLLLARVWSITSELKRLSEDLRKESIDYHAAQRKHHPDSWHRGYFNGLADCASKTAQKLKEKLK